MAISDFRDFIYPVWYKDSRGNKISYSRTNETYTIVKNKILLKEIPEEFNKVHISDYYEVKQGDILNSNEYCVDYYTGEITFNSSQDAKTITVTQYNAKGIIYIFAERVISSFDPQNNNIKETLADVTNNLSGKDEYNASTTYFPRNIVTFAGSSYLCKQQCTGITPENRSCWQKIAQYGQGLVYRDTYNTDVTYEANNFVSYNNQFYFCKQTTKGNLPTSETYWSILPFPICVPTVVKNTVVVGSSPVSSVNIGISSFNAIKDDLTVICNSTYIEETTDYTVSGTTITKVSGTWDAGTVFNFKVLKSVINNIFYSDGSLIQDGTITDDKLASSNKIGNLTSLNYNTKDDIVNVLNKNKSAINVKDFGAKGDDIADDRQAIQNAIDYMFTLPNGGALYIPAGTYRISSKITIPNTKSFIIYGDGISSQIHGGLLYNDKIFEFGGDTINGNLSLFRDFAIIGPASGQSIGIYARNCNGFIISRVNFQNQIIGVELYQCYSVEISSCFFTNCYTHGIACDTSAHNLIVDKCNFYSCGMENYGATIIMWVATDNIVITNNDFEYCFLATQITNGTAIAINNNYIEWCTENPIVFSGVCQGVSIKENWIALGSVPFTIQNVTNGKMVRNTLYNQSVQYGESVTDFIIGYNYHTGMGTIASTKLNTVVLQNNWVHQINYGDVGYIKDSNGIVYLEGNIVSGTTPGVAFTLPVGYRPNKIMTFGNSGTSGFCQVKIDTNGEVSVVTATGSNEVSLNGVSFFARG